MSGLFILYLIYKIFKNIDKKLEENNRRQEIIIRVTNLNVFFNSKKIASFLLHATGFEPVMFYQKADYESAAFVHSAIHALTRFLVNYNSF